MFQALLQRWRSRGEPSQPLLPKEVVAARIRLYAGVNGKTVREPLHFRLEERAYESQGRNAGRRPVYVVSLGTSRPMPLVEVDAVSGEVIAWRQLAR